MALRVKQLLAAANHQLNQNQHGQTHGIQESDGMLQQIYTQLESITLLHKNHTDYNNESDKLKQVNQAAEQLSSKDDKKKKVITVDSILKLVNEIKHTQKELLLEVEFLKGVKQKQKELFDHEVQKRLELEQELSNHTNNSTSPSTTSVAATDQDVTSYTTEDDFLTVCSFPKEVQVQQVQAPASPSSTLSPSIHKNQQQNTDKKKESANQDKPEQDDPQKKKEKESSDQHQDVQSSSSSTKKSYRHLQKEYVALEKLQIATLSELTDLKQQLYKHSSKDGRAYLTALETENGRLHRQLKETKGQCDEATGRMQLLEKRVVEFASLKQQHAQLEEQLQELEQERNDLKQQLEAASKTQKKNDSSSLLLQAKDQELASLQAQLLELETNYQVVKSELDQLQTKVQQVEKERNVAIKEGTVLQTKLQTLEEKSQDATTERAVLQVQLQEAKSTLSNLQEQYDTCQKELKTLQDQYQAQSVEMSDSQASLQKLQSKQTEYTLAMKDALVEYKALQQQHDQVCQKLQKYETSGVTVVVEQSSGPTKQQNKKKMDPQDTSDHDHDYNDDQYTEFASYHRHAPQDPSEAQAIEVVSLASDSFSVPSHVIGYMDSKQHQCNSKNDPPVEDRLVVVTSTASNYSHSYGLRHNHNNHCDEDPIVVLTRQHDEAMAKLSSLQEELQQAQQEVLLHKNNEAARKQDLQTIMQHYEELQVEYERLEQEHIELQQQLDQVQSSAGRPELKTRTGKTKKLQQQDPDHSHRSVRTASTHCETTVVSTASSSASSASKNDSSFEVQFLQDTLEERDAQFQDLKRKHQRLNDHHSELIRDYALLQQDSKKLTTKLDICQRKLAQAKKEADRVTKIQPNKLGEVLQLSKKYQRECTLQQVELEKMQTQLQNCKTQLKKKDVEVRTTRHQLTKVHAQFQRLEGLYKKSVQEGKLQRDELENLRLEVSLVS